MPRVEHVKHEHVIFINGIGLDEFLSEDANILILDEEYADIYGDYVFLGYNVYVAPFEVDRCDLAGLLRASLLMRERRPLIVVCGDGDVSRCAYALAAMLVEGGRDPREAAEYAASLLSGIGSVRRSKHMMATLRSLSRMTRLVGLHGVATIVELASNYSLGGDLHHSESIVWASELGFDDNTLLAIALHFLVEGPDEPRRLLNERLEAIGGVDTLERILGRSVDEPLDILECYAEGGECRGAKLLRAVEALEPGGQDVLLVEEGKPPRAYCRSCGGVPCKECVERVGRASRLLREAGYGELAIGVLEGGGA